MSPQGWRVIRLHSLPGQWRMQQRRLPACLPACSEVLSVFPLSPPRWLRLQGTLKEHHETLQLALEAAAFLQQAEVLLEAIHAKVLRCRFQLPGIMQNSKIRMLVMTDDW